VRGTAPPGLRLATVLVIATIVQAGVLSHLRIAGVAPDLLLVVAIAGGLVAGETRGALGGFFAGLAIDLITWGRPFGLAILVYTLVGWGCGRVRTATAFASRLADVVVAAAASVLAAAAYVVGVGIFGDGGSLAGDFPAVAVVTALWSSLLVLPVSAVARWVWGDVEDATAWAR
jgi:rod shape-determining protein MreD